MPDHVCRHCSSTFFRAQDRPYAYCSRACYHASRIGRPSPKTVQWVERTCQQCGAEFRSKSSAGARINYCTRWCQAVASASTHSALTLSATDAAYLAALVDGEGTIIVADRRATRPGSTHPSVYLSVAGAYLPMHEWLVKTTGVGRVREQLKSASSLALGGRKKVHTWRCHSASTVALLRQIRPYMLEKAIRADRAIASFERGYEAYDAAAGSTDDSNSD